MASLAELKAAEAAFAELAPQPFHLPLGNLAPALTGLLNGAPREAWLSFGPRERIAGALRGCPLQRLIEPTAGARPYRLLPATPGPSARVLQALGMALGSGNPVVCTLGLAGAANGAFFEAMNGAAQHKAHLVVVVFSESIPADAPIGPQLSADLSRLAAAFGIEHVRVPATETAVSTAVAAACAAPGPHLIEVSLGFSPTQH